MLQNQEKCNINSRGRAATTGNYLLLVAAEALLVTTTDYRLKHHYLRGGATL